MQNHLASGSRHFGSTHPIPVATTQRKAMLQMISQQIKEVINPYAPPENYRLKIGFDMESSNLSSNPKRCAFVIELRILDPYLHIVVKKIAGSFRESINLAVNSLQKNLKLVKRTRSTSRRRVLLMSAILLPVFSSLMGCAHRRMEKQIDSKLTQETQVTDQVGLQKEAHQAVEEDPNLTQDQKMKLLELQNNTRTKMTDLKEKGIQLRSLLIKDMLAQEDTSDEVTLIKKRIKKNENEKIKTLFSAIDRTNVILGKDTKIRAKMLQAFMDRHWTSDMDAKATPQ